MLFISHRFFSQFIWHSDSCSYFIAVTLFLNLCDQKSLLLRHLFFMNFYKCQRKWRGILSTPLELGMPSKKKKNSLMFIEGYYYTAHIQHLIILLTVKLRFSHVSVDVKNTLVHSPHDLQCFIHIMSKDVYFLGNKWKFPVRSGLITTLKNKCS